jgi:oligosaccharide repeat unit polymerase
MSYLRWAILLCGAAGLVSSAVLAINTVRTLGAEDLLTALTSYGAQIYELRFNGEVSGLMYVVFLPYAGCVLSGIYCARLGRITLTVLLPVFAMLADGFISMQRLGIFVGVLLFTFSYLLTPKSTKLYIPKWQKVAIACIILLGFFLVTISRAATQVMESGSATLADAGDTIPGLSSLYFYASAPIPTFSEYLKHPEEEGKNLWGRYMFASIYRFASKLGFDTYVPYYAPFYYTPIPDNAATYLREVHWDFGATAIFIFPFGLGFLIAYLEIRNPTVLTVVLSSFLYIVVFFSCHFNFMGGGGWYFPLPIALLVAYIVSTPQLSFAAAPRIARRT